VCPGKQSENTVLKVMLVDEDPDRAADVREALTRAGCKVVSTLTSAMELYDRVSESSPDVIIIDTESPSRDVLEHIMFISRDQPRPIVMFSGDRGSETIRLAVRAGVTAYIVDGLSEARIQPILSVAVERFEAEQELKQELSASKSMLAERKAIERAKGLIMKQAACDEETAFRHLRKFAMDRGVKMIDAAQTVIAMGLVAPNNSA
jgi:two-component system, response regulator / RNA-binding antiterminator